MPRLTRTQSQERTRDQLVATARTLFLRDGYLATSLDRIADEAGYSKGAVYSNFRGKDDLCLAVLDLIHAEQAARVAHALSTGATLEDRLTAFTAWAEANIGDVAWTSLEVEFALSARRDDTLRAELAQRDRAIRDLLAGVISAFADDFGLTLPLPPATAATALLSLGIGVGVQRALDPGIPVAVIADTIRALAAPR